VSREVTREEALAGIAKALSDVEDAIQQHPGRTVSVYQQGKVAFLEGQQGVEHTDWSRATGLTLPQLALTHRYLLAASFMSAWYHMRWDKKRRDQAAQSACLLVSALGFDPLEVMQRFTKYEQLWRLSMRSARIGVSRTLACVLVFLLVGAVILWLVFG
jgi:hypothetical protein